MRHISDLFSTRLELDAMAHHLARQFAAVHADRPSKAVQVYRNTLCVCAVYDYLSQQGLEASLEYSDSWNPVDQVLSDVADLYLEGVGRVECCPVLDATEAMEIGEFWDDRLAYIGVQLNHDGANATQAMILGFVTQPEQERIPLTELRSPQELLPLLTHKPTPVFTHLSQWLQNTFETGWEAIDTILNSRNLAYAMRDQNHSIRRAKQLDVGLRLDEVSVALLIGLEPRPNNKVWVRIQLHPVGTVTQLPPNLVLTLCSEAGDKIQQETSRSHDFMMQLAGVTLPAGKQFQVQIMYGEVGITERFMV